MKVSPIIFSGMLVLGLHITAAATTHYVNIANTAPAWPFTTWESAATNIQDAVDAAIAGEEVLVTNGVYATGGRAVYQFMTNRVVIDKAVTVRSVSGPNLTWIVGQGGNGTVTNNGYGAIRCVFVGSNAVLSGFTLTNGHTLGGGNFDKEGGGGAAWCEISGALTNCTLVGNSASFSGGGAYGGTLNNCILNGNSSYQGGGAYNAALANCTLKDNSASYSGGGAYSGIINNCTLTCNSAAFNGGGASYSSLNNCVLTGNSTYQGGGAYDSILNNCTLSGNSAYWGGGGASSSALNNCTLTGNSGALGGGVFYGTITNCIVYYNISPEGLNYNGRLQIRLLLYYTAADRCR